MKRFLLGLGAVILLGVFVVAGALSFLPASYLIQPFVQMTQGHVVALNSQGTVWNGSAQLALRSGGQTEAARAAALPGELHWQVGEIHWFPPAIEIRLQGEPLIQQKFSIVIGMNKIELTPGAIFLPAQLLEAAGAPFNTLKPGGKLLLSWTKIGLQSRGERYLHASMEWREASSVLSKVIPLGSYRALLTVEGERGQLELSSLAGPMFLSANGLWSNGRWQMNGVARAEPAQREALAPLMTLLGRQQPDGSVQWKAGNQ